MAKQLLEKNRRHLDSETDAMLSVVLADGVKAGKCARLPAADLPDSLLDDEARALCGG